MAFTEAAVTVNLVVALLREVFVTERRVAVNFYSDR